MIPFVIMYLRMYSKIIIHISSPCSCNEKTDPNLASTKKKYRKTRKCRNLFAQKDILFYNPCANYCNQYYVYLGKVQ